MSETAPVPCTLGAKHTHALTHTHSQWEVGSAVGWWAHLLLLPQPPPPPPLVSLEAEGNQSVAPDASAPLHTGQRRALEECAAKHAVRTVSRRGNPPFNKCIDSPGMLAPSRNGHRR